MFMIWFYKLEIPWCIHVKTYYNIACTMNENLFDLICENTSIACMAINLKCIHTYLFYFLCLVKNYICITPKFWKYQWKIVKWELKICLFGLAENKLMGRFPCLSSSTGRALSLLSSKADSWVPPSDLSSRSSAALRELIAENRAAILARQIILDRDWHSNQHGADQDLGDPQQRSGFNSIEPNHHHHQHHHMFPEQQGWDRFQESGTHVTLDLMQAPSPAFGFLSARGKTKSEEEECSDLWNSFNGPNLV